MIHFLNGKVHELTPSYTVLNINGVGYYVGISLQTYQKLVEGKDAFLNIQQIIREDAHLLFGFYTKDEKEMFNHLLSVSGVGAVSALILLSSLEISEIASAILSGNSAQLQKIKGIGTKTAQRIIVDLKDKMLKFNVSEENKSLKIDNKIKEEALSALEVLGIAKKTAEKIADRILAQNSDLKVEELVKQILKNI